MNGPNLEHRTRRVKDIVQEYLGGRLVIPEFQRDYVWKPGRAPTLLDSLVRNWPVSSLLIWQNDDADIEARRAQPRPAHGATRWLIDGQQRVTTLSRLFHGDEGLEVVFNAKTGQFARPNAAIKQDKTWVSVHEIWDDEAYRRLQRDLPDTAAGRKLAEQYEKVRSILEYEIPVVEMVGHAFDDAVGAFERINTLGVRLKKQDIESAQVAAKHSGFIRHQVAPFLQKLHQDGFKRLHVMHLFRACAFVAQPDGRARTPLHQLERKEVEKAWEQTVRATHEALGIVRSELGLVDMTVLWSGALLVPVIALCARTRPRDRNPKELAGWMALASLHHRYSGSVDTALDEDMRACRADDPVGALLRALRSKRTQLRAGSNDFGGRLNDKSALFASWVACKHRGARDLLTGGQLVLQKSIDRHHILARARFERGQRAEADTLANIAFISGAANKSLGDDDPAMYLPKVRQDVLRSQCIPTDKDLWRVDRADDFWEARRELLADAFNDFLTAHLESRRL